MSGFVDLVVDLERAAEPAGCFAAIHDFLAGLSGEEFGRMLPEPGLDGLSPLRANLLAAMVEFAAHRLGVRPPAWTAKIPPLAEPWFGSELKSVRVHLLAASPVAYRRRNLFVDSSVGDRV